jgi:hypothetical protein
MSALRLPPDRRNSEAKMARDPEGNYPTKVFSPDETSVRALGSAIDVEGTNPNTKIDEVSTTGGSGQLQFDLTNDAPGR